MGRWQVFMLREGQVIANGAQVLSTHYCGGGSGIFQSLLIVESLGGTNYENLYHPAISFIDIPFTVNSYRASFSQATYCDRGRGESIQDVSGLGSCMAACTGNQPVGNGHWDTVPFLVTQLSDLR